jgi:hypothetical protein
VCHADGRPVVLRCWAGAAARIAEVRRRAALWGSTAGDGAVAVRDVAVLGDDLVLVSDLATGGGLDALVARRGGLTPGQVVTLVVPVAQTLAAAHDRGLVHGRISPRNVVLDHVGRPMLTDWLLAGDREPAADVTALVAMALGWLADDAPETVLTALRSAVDARILADELASAVPAEPLLASPMTVAGDVLSGDPVTVARRGVVGVVIVVGISVAVAVGGGVLWGRGNSAAGGATLPPPISLSATPTPSPTGMAPDWASVLRALERRRMNALAVGDRRLLAASELRGTTLWRHDARAVSWLTATGARLRGVRVHIMSVTVRSVQPGRVVVRVVDALSSYEVVDRRGALLVHHPARGPRAVFVLLTGRRGQWLLADVSRRSP